jgi:NADH-quinone oxidoreductase subunit N
MSLNLQLLSPEICLLAFALAAILMDLLTKRKGVVAAFSIVGLAASAGFALSLWNGPPTQAFGGALVVDQFAIFFKLLLTGAAILVILASNDYVSKFVNNQGEFYALLLTSTLGMMLLTSTGDLIAIYVALETSSISLYVLTTLLKDGKSTESGLKYLILGSIASAVLVYGMALVFGMTGSTRLMDIATAVKSIPGGSLLASPGLLLGIVLMVAGFGFKISAVPFQMWVPDVYEGAPTPVTAYLSVASKAAGFAVIVRVFFTAFGTPAWLSHDWGTIIAVLAAITMTAGNLMALKQANIKRLFGYSSIAQAGYLMVGLAAVGATSTADIYGRGGLLFFLISYTLTNLGAFIAIIALSNKTGSDETDSYAGMGKRAPVLAAALSLCLFSLTGLPPTAGLMAKFYIFNGAVQSGLLWLVIVAVINSCISAFYYLRVVKVMWFNAPPAEDKVPSSWALRVALIISSLGVLFIGIVPGPVVEFAQAAIRILTN